MTAKSFCRATTAAAARCRTFLFFYIPSFFSSFSASAKSQPQNRIFALSSLQLLSATDKKRPSDYVSDRRGVETEIDARKAESAQISNHRSGWASHCSSRCDLSQPVKASSGDRGRPGVRQKDLGDPTLPTAQSDASMMPSGAILASSGCLELPHSPVTFELQRESDSWDLVACCWCCAWDGACHGWISAHPSVIGQAINSDHSDPSSKIGNARFPC
ncbi:hypothetical protein V8C26DRAFT_24463 [Trichoderma gracile]